MVVIPKIKTVRAAYALTTGRAGIGPVFLDVSHTGPDTVLHLSVYRRRTLFAKHPRERTEIRRFSDRRRD